METMSIAPADTTGIGSGAKNRMTVKPKINGIAIPKNENMLIKTSVLLEKTLPDTIISMVKKNFPR